MTNPQDTIPHYDSRDSEWVAWHKKLLQFGYKKQEANEVFIQAFTQRAGSQANTYTLRSYAKTQGFTIDGGYLGGAVDAVGGTGAGIGKMFTNFSTFVVLAIALGCLLIGFVVWNTIKPDNE
jgi:hypothetical protein